MTIMIRNKQSAYKNMATENSVNNTICTMHNEYYTKQLTQNFKTAYFLLCSVQSNAESSNN
jgi:hypothetical protein